MNTVNIRIKAADIQSFMKDLKRMNIRHYPFHADNDVYEIELYPNSKIMMLRLKYDLA